MIAVPEPVIEHLAVVRGAGESLADLAVDCARTVEAGDVGAVVAATFSNPDRFPSLAVRVAGELGLARNVPAFDLQLACSAFPYGVLVATQLSASLSRPVLLIDGDVQTPLVDASDHATGRIFSDACTAAVVRAGDAGGRFDFLSRYDTALSCPAGGPIRMDGFKVFTFVATEVSAMLRSFLADERDDSFLFAPHQANPYMIRQLADALDLRDRLLTVPEDVLNPGSCSVPMTLACNAGRVRGRRVLIAGFGAGYSAGVGFVRVGSDCRIAGV